MLTKISNINTKNILILIAILTLWAAFYKYLHKPSSEVFEREKTALEQRITENRKIREAKKVEQEKIYNSWKKEDEQLEKSINADKERISALKILLWENNSIIPSASAMENTDSWNTTESGSGYQLQKLREKICKIQPNSPLCTEDWLLERLKKITDDRIDKPYVFPMLLGMTNSESSLGTNFAPSQSCGKHNNWWGIKWKKNDDWSSAKDQPIPKSDGCWLYTFDSIEEYWKSKVNTIRYWYAGCLGENAKNALQCISRTYVWWPGVKHSWAENASIFLY